ncbi:MAG: hybrid sensor histidine kinase/response regulator, partial [Betaproteobacteria bacterium]
VVMPGGMDGIALAREARSRQPGLRILLASGYAQALLGADDLPGALLNKPYRKSDLAKRFAQLCSG